MSETFSYDSNPMSFLLGSVVLWIGSLLELALYRIHYHVELGGIPLPPTLVLLLGLTTAVGCRLSLPFTPAFSEAFTPGLVSA